MSNEKNMSGSDVVNVVLAIVVIAVVVIMLVQIIHALNPEVTYDLTCYSGDRIVLRETVERDGKYWRDKGGNLISTNKNCIWVEHIRE